MTQHPNAFRPQGPTRADVTRLPQHLREAIDRPVEMRKGEIICMVLTRKDKRLCDPAARFYVEIESPETKMVGVKILDFKGVDVIAQLQISDEAQATLLSRFVEIYRTLGGSKEDLIAMYEGNTDER